MKFNEMIEALLPRYALTERPKITLGATDPFDATCAACFWHYENRIAVLPGFSDGLTLNVLAHELRHAEQVAEGRIAELEDACCSPNWQAYMLHPIEVEAREAGRKACADLLGSDRSELDWLMVMRAEMLATGRAGEEGLTREDLRGIGLR